jgi:hypothetical protein
MRASVRERRAAAPGTLGAMERRDLYENDLTEEDLPSPARRDDAAHDLELDPDILPPDDDSDITIESGEPMPEPAKGQQPKKRR